MTTSLKIENIFDELDSYLEESRLYYVNESEEHQVNTRILSEWDLKIKNAVTEDFLEIFPNLKIDFGDRIFQVSADNEQGSPTTFLISVTLTDLNQDEALKAFIKSIISHKKTFIYLDSIYANQEKYKGSSKTLKHFFKKLKTSDKQFGCFNPISLRDLLNDGG